MMSGVVHQPEQHCFTLNLNGQLGKLEYHFVGDQTVEFTSTHIPYRLRGQGHGRDLAQAGLQWAQSSGYSVNSRCTYIDKILQESALAEQG